MLLYLGNWGYFHFTLPQGLDIVGAWALWLTAYLGKLTLFKNAIQETAFWKCCCPVSEWQGCGRFW